MERISYIPESIKKGVRVAGVGMIAATGVGESNPTYYADTSHASIRTPEEMQISRINLQTNDKGDVFVTLADEETRLYTDEFSNIAAIREKFDTANQIDTDGKLLSYDPVKSRNRYEQCQTPQERWEWRRNEWKEITSTLRERYNCVESPMDFFVDDDGKLRNQEFSAEPIETIIRRGVAYQEQQGSKELARERGELVGIMKTQDYLTDLEREDDEAVLVLSPHGGVEGTNYTKDFVDLYSLVINPETGEREIKATRYSTNMTYEEYRVLAETLSPGYFDSFDSERESLDAYILSHPIKIGKVEHAREVIVELLTFDEAAFRGYEFDMVDEILAPFKDKVRQAIMTWDDPVKVAHSINTMYHIGDEAARLIEEGDWEDLKKLRDWSLRLDERKIDHEIELKGGIPLQSRMVGCGLSEGFFSNSVGMYGIDAKKDPNLCKDCGTLAKPHFHCGGSKTEVVKDKDGRPVVDEHGKEKTEKVMCTYKVIVGEGTRKCPDCGKGAVC